MPAVGQAMEDFAPSTRRRSAPVAKALGRWKSDSMYNRYTIASEAAFAMASNVLAL
jgi:hypothetical protein